MRNQAVSISKGIAIILMVTAHARCEIWWQNYINMFHMPLFLFMSGYCFKEKHFFDASGFFVKKMKGIWWPFVKWQLIFLLLHNVFFSLNIYNDEYGFGDKVSHEYGIKETLQNAFFIITTMSHGEQLLGGFWFLKSLLVGTFAFYFTSKTIFYSLKKKVDLIVGGVLLGITLAFSFIGKGIPGIGINAKDFMAGFFIWSGYMYRKYKIQVDKKWWFAIAAALLIAIGTEYWQCSMLELRFSLIFPYIVTALLGIVMVLSISNFISNHDNWLKRFLVFTGDNTLDILTWHFLLFKIGSLLLIGIYGVNIKRLAEFPVIEEYAYQGWWILYLLVGLTMALGISMTKDRINRRNH